MKQRILEGVQTADVDNTVNSNLAYRPQFISNDYKSGRKVLLEMILFPSSYFSNKKVDEDLQSEYDAVANTGLFKIVLFDYQKWFNEGIILLDKETGLTTWAVYRGWMMQPEQYEEFYKELLSKNIRLVTTPLEYQLFHVFPNIYPKLHQDTAKILTYSKGTVINIEEVKSIFKRFMVKDYVKSVKGTEFPQFFDGSITQAQFDKWMQVFYKYRGDLFTGGICIKEFLELKQYDSKTNEYRVYYINHEICTVSRNSLQASYTPLPPRELLEKYKELESKFYTIDYAELADGSWRIIEAGDGQVSGLSPMQNYEVFFRSLYQCFK